MKIVDYQINNETLASVNLIAEQDIPKNSFSNFINDLTKTYCKLLN